MKQIRTIREVWNKFMPYSKRSRCSKKKTITICYDFRDMFITIRDTYLTTGSWDNISKIALKKVQKNCMILAIKKTLEIRIF